MGNGTNLSISGTYYIKWDVNVQTYLTAVHHIGPTTHGCGVSDALVISSLADRLEVRFHDSLEFLGVYRTALVCVECTEHVA